jgi:hypothetical protein
MGERMTNNRSKNLKKYNKAVKRISAQYGEKYSTIRNLIKNGVKAVNMKRKRKGIKEKVNWGFFTKRIKKGTKLPDVSEMFWMDVESN